MSRFYAEIEGQAGGTSRMGSERSGMWSHTRGWDVGIEVNCRADGEADVISVGISGGSNGPSQERLPLLRVEQGPEGPSVVWMSDELKQIAKQLA